MPFTPLACFFLALAAFGFALKALFVVWTAKHDYERSKEESRRAQFEADCASTNAMIAKMQLEHCEQPQVCPDCREYEEGEEQGG